MTKSDVLVEALNVRSKEEGLGKPMDNGIIDAFNGNFREECLNVNRFLSLENAGEKIESWRREYNEWRPHGSFDNLTPVQYRQIHGGQKSPNSLIMAGTVFV
jgi:putative transposase